MGCDGGTIPRRDELVRLKKKPEQKDKDAERQFRWKHCSLTQEKLQRPIVMCGLGRLYSKQNIIEHLLEKDKMPESCAHIKSLKDIKDLNLTANPAYEQANDDRSAQFICSLIGLEMSGQFRFVALWTCGCVFAERALKEIKDKICSVCQKAFSEQDVVVLNGSDDDVDLMRTRLESRVARIKAEKKAKAKAKEKMCASEAKTDTAQEAGPSRPTVPGKPSGSSLKPIVPNKRALISDKIGDDPIFKKSKDGYSVAEDPNATAVYKSLFTTHDSEKDQKRAHWVTYNPFYN
ncbi:replication termination factor 2 [Toxorhynchites rutilus septentrionalis]|uniref:replication termination factor 2 n=1 Tax=Toxorhynchites rutilus septentrionalis TaxID=329112 RepID=UPI002478C17E|nr:replication termination factor 2 [Toxorhynchites rutilus septentrionalis]